MARARHPNKEIEDAVSYAEELKWTVKPIKGHAWGSLYCAHHDRDGCKVSVWGTPRNAQGHAKAIIRAVNRCPHEDRKEDNDEDA
jgi:hypothetical protein